jgi:hypothetical protein
MSGNEKRKFTEQGRRGKRKEIEKNSKKRHHRGPTRLGVQLERLNGECSDAYSLERRL